MDLDRILRDFVKRRTWNYRVASVAPKEAGLIARHAGALPRALFITFQDTLSCSTRVCLEKQAVARRRQLDFELDLRMKRLETSHAGLSLQYTRQDSSRDVKAHSLSNNVLAVLLREEK